MKSNIIALFITLFTLSTVSYAQSAHSGGVNVALMDGSVRFVSSSVSHGGGAGKVHFADLSGIGSLGIDGSLKTKTIQVESAFPANFMGGVYVAVADLPARSELECMASTDFSAAVPMRPDAFAIVFDRPTSAVRFSFGVDRDLGYGCKVVRLNGEFNNDGVVDAADYVVWRRAVNLPGNKSGYTTTVKLIRRDGEQFETYYKFELTHAFIS